MMQNQRAMGMPPSSDLRRQQRSLVWRLADTLVRDEALTLRQAHEIAAHTVRAAITAGHPLDSGFAAFSTAFQDLIGRPPAAAECAFKAAVSSAAFVTAEIDPAVPRPRASHRAEAADNLKLAFAKLLE